MTNAPDAPLRRSSGREIRLLVLTIVVSAGVLGLLARFRFPAAPVPEAPVRPPLERLAARATYDDLALTMQQLEPTVRAQIAVLRVAPGQNSLEGTVPGYAAALRVRGDLLLAHLPPSAQVQGVVGDEDAVPVPIAFDQVRELALVRATLPRAPSPTLLSETPSVTAPTYLVEAAPGRGGAALRPLFAARADPFFDPRWDHPLLSLGPDIDAHRGAFAFALDGRLAGLLLSIDGMATLVPLSLLQAATEQLLQGVPARGDLGVRWQRLTPRLAAATGAAAGVVVGHVDPRSGKTVPLMAGDVVEAVEGDPVHSVEALDLRIARTPPGESLALHVRRAGEELDLTVVVGQAAEPAPARGRELGWELRPAPGRGSTIVRVAEGSLAAAAGLQAGDAIITFHRQQNPLPGDVDRIWKTAASGDALLVVITRQAGHLVLSLDKP